MSILALVLIAAGSIAWPVPAQSQPDGDTGGVDRQLWSGRVEVEDIPPDPRGGKAYRLRYVVAVPLQIYWRFKTDFDNEFLLGNKYIDEHRVVARSNGAVVTENRYTHSPGVVFRWKTTADEKACQIDFVLLNPLQCGQRFHYGKIRAINIGDKTVVVQEGFFDFFGAKVWAHYPWAGGMHHFLQYTARWEQNTVLRLRKRYER
jgi:hypothetical protein